MSEAEAFFPPLTDEQNAELTIIWDQLYALYLAKANGDRAEWEIDAEIENATRAGPLPQYYLGLAAEVLLAAGRPADGVAHLDRAIAGVEEPGIGFYLPEIYRLRGACLLALDRGNVDEARLAFATALDIARRQGAVIFQRRAEASLSEITRVGNRG